MSKNILIIGGNRFFGRHLAIALISKGIKPVLFNRQSIDDGLGEQVERIKGDRDQYDSLREAALSRKWDVVFDQVCFSATQAKLACAHFEKNVNQYIVTSTQSVYDYGVNLSEISFDSHNYKFNSEVSPSVDYGEAKRQMEATFYSKAAFPVMAIRFPIVLGPDDYTKRLSWHFSRLQNHQGVYFPNLQAKMSFIHSEVAGRLLSELVGVNWARPLNVASHEVMELKKLMELIELEMGSSFKFDKNEGNDNKSPFGIKNHWFMNLDQLQKLGLNSLKLSDWLPQLLKEEAQKASIKR
jgi:nucleoside-diphosphate-sugar epimerase